MIKYKLECNDCEIIFDSWFASSKEYDKLKKNNFLICYNCNSKKIKKTLMAPQFIKSKKKSSVIKFVNSLQLFGIGYSWGGFESLVLLQDLRTKTKYTQTRRYFRFATDEHIVRLHIGLEDPKDLIEDLKRSLKHIK